MDTPLLWTPHHCGHFSPGLSGFPYIFQPVQGHHNGALCCPLTTVDTSLLWTLFGRPSDVHISEVLLYLHFKHYNILPTSNEILQSNFFLESITPKTSEMKIWLRKFFIQSTWNVVVFETQIGELHFYLPMPFYLMLDFLATAIIYWFFVFLCYDVER